MTYRMNYEAFIPEYSREPNPFERTMLENCRDKVSFIDPIAIEPEIIELSLY